MAKNDMFDGMDLFSLFGDDIMPSEEKKEETKEEKKEMPSSTNESYEDTNLEDGEDDDSLDMTTDEDESADTKKESRKATSGKKKAAPKTVNLPARCIGRNFDTTVDGSGTVTYEELLGTLHAMGIKEVANATVKPLPQKGGVVYFNYPTNNGTKEATQVFPSDNLKAVVADGLEQMEITPDGFEGYLQNAPKEISVGNILEKWTATWPMWAGEELNYDSKTQTAVPVGGKQLTDSDSLTLPLEVVKGGKKITLTADDFPMNDTISHKDIVNFLWGEIPAKVSLLKLASGTIVANYSIDKEVPITVERKFAEVNKNASATLVTETYALPLSVYFVTLNQRFELDSSMFNGKERVTEEDVLSLLKQSYSMLRSKDRRIESIYVKETHTLSVALVSGTKGSAYALPESPNVGLFKLIRSMDEFEEVKRLPFF